MKQLKVSEKQEKRTCSQLQLYPQSCFIIIRFHLLTIRKDNSFPKANKQNLDSGIEVSC